MIRLLSIRQLAVVERLEIEFDNGLNILTGETGAGKSILIDAVALLLGERASPDSVRAGADSAVIQAEIDVGSTTRLVRREVSAQGRSRAYIDDDLVTAGGLRSLLEDAVELHGQHEHQRLLQPAAQLALLDEFAGCHAQRQSTASAFSDWQRAVEQLAAASAATEDRQAQLEQARFELDDIDRVGPVPGEDAELDAERLVLAQADRLYRLTQDAYDVLYERDQAVLPQLRSVFRRIDELASIDGCFADIVSQREAVETPLEEIARFLRGYNSRLDLNGDRLQAVEDRLAALSALKRRYGLTLDSVLSRRASLLRRIDDIDRTSERLEEAKRQARRGREAFLNQARTLSQRRRAAAPDLCRAIEAELADLAMPGARCEFVLSDLREETAWSSRGIDGGELLLASNLGEPLKPLNRVASGGELSRIMLACHMVAQSDPSTGALIFDEVDAGIGGRAADAVGARLRRLGERRQVLCVTHLPQVAAYGSAQYKVSKHERAGRTVSEIERLSPQARVDELARMMAGHDITPAVRAAARTLLDARQGATGEGESKERAKAKATSSRRARPQSRG